MIDMLNTEFGRPGAIAFEAGPLGGPVARLAHGPHAAMVALQGAQVLSWRHAGHERLWLSPAARLGTGKAVRGGIPVCWPWFGPHPGDPAKPAHGFVRTRDWRVVASDRDADAARLRLAIATEKRDRALWPHAASLELEVALGDGLSLALATRNGGGAPFPLTSALHTYFRVAEIARAFVEGLDGRTYIDKLDCLARKVQSGAVTIDREVDRIYLGDTRAITLVDGTTGDRIAITSRGSASAVVWNPWIDKTARLGDMGAADAFRGMLCIETANAGDDVIALEPGATHVLGASYSVG